MGLVLKTAEVPYIQATGQSCATIDQPGASERNMEQVYYYL